MVGSRFSISILIHPLARCAVVLLLGVLICHIGYQYYYHRPFDEESWRIARKNGDTTATFAMSSSLETILKGKQLTREQLFGMLGEPDRMQSSVFIYDLGFHWTGGVIGDHWKLWIGCDGTRVYWVKRAP